MSRKGNPWDNVACESFMKTLKYEEVLRNEYRDLAEARASIREFLEKVYNQKRLHSALGYLPPAEFEAQRAAPHPEAARRQPGMSLQPGYSSAGCSPAEPASASPARLQNAIQWFCRSIDFQRTANSVLTVCVSQGDKRSFIALAESIERGQGMLTIRQGLFGAA
jgi:hypothetical protein